MSYENNEEIDTIKKSKYNSGIAKEMRRNDLWKEANTHSRTGFFIKWNEDLDCIWSELCVDIKEGEFESKKTDFNRFDKEIFDEGQIVDSFNEGFKEVPLNINERRAEHYKILRNKEIFLRRLENHVGKGTAWEDDDEDGF